MIGFIGSFFIEIAESFCEKSIRKTFISLGGLVLIIVTNIVAIATIKSCTDSAFGGEQWLFIPVSTMIWFLTGILSKWHQASLIVAGVLLAASLNSLTIWMIGPTAGAIVVVGLWFWFLSKVWASLGLPR